MKRLAVFAALLGLLHPETAQATHNGPQANALADRFEIHVWADHEFVPTLHQPRLPIREMRKVTVAPYARHLTSGAGWTDGDREGYGCAFMHLIEKGDGLNPVSVGRVTFKLPKDAAGYAAIVDKFMDEGERNVGGSLEPVKDVENEKDDHAKVGGCAGLNLNPSYGNLVGARGLVPILEFLGPGGRVLETRSYVKRAASPGHLFKIAKASSQRIVVVGYQDRVPVIAIYYDALNGGTVRCIQGCPTSTVESPKKKKCKRFPPGPKRRRCRRHRKGD
jgi:hypothetical protein